MSCRALAVMLAVVVSVCAFPRNGGDNRTATQIIDKIISAGYPAELHHVTTEDGYILGVHRIPYGRNGPSEQRRPVVFVMHGLMGSSANFIHVGSDYAIAYNLADAEFDVWLGNARGNTYSRAHVSLNPDDSQEKHDFFDFSWEEIGLIDLPTMIDYALAKTGESKLHYIGHSQGGTSFLVLNSMKPEYNEKFWSAHLLAGVGYMSNFPNTALRTTALMTNSLYSLGTSLGLVEIRTLDDLPVSLTRQGYTYIDNCFGDVKYKAYCEMLGLEHIVGHSNSISMIGGASLKQFAHYGQNIRDRIFRRWDYGLLTNRQVYGSITPPSYNLGLVTVDVTMHYSVSDGLLDERDVLAMAADMPNTNARKVERETFSHLDFIQSNDVRELVTNYIIYRLKLAERI
ncbi:lipase 3-like [Choristoneura fumiferana]|uniref:lipase 3-like n=1 Tax=Choristoneura fumiferana TaxID=7141 RepID=UPI003D15C9C5